ncbi:hypothetical protein TWF718_008680 [Orbilia javanica]|uniref:Uncharacterized protein n=1 Tax=Orbilia javanica TaxID=47235 RepID=A0AAN8MUQ3_9PEZI
MKFSTILLTIFGFNALTALAIPAPIPAAAPAAAPAALLKKSESPQSNGIEPLTKRGDNYVDLVADVQVCIDAVVDINSKYAAQKPYTRTACQNWAGEVVIKIKALIEVISAYPSGCTFPPIDDCVNVFVQLVVTVFVQLQVFVDVGGLLGIILLTVDLLLSLLLGLCGDLLNVVISLCILIESRVQAGICGLIIQGCGGSLDSVYIQVIVQVLVQAGISL